MRPLLYAALRLAARSPRSLSARTSGTASRGRGCGGRPSSSSRCATCPPRGGPAATSASRSVARGARGIRARPTTTSASSPRDGWLAGPAAAARALFPRGAPSVAGASSSPAVLPRALPLLGNASYVALASGFLMTDMLALRVALVGGYAGLVCFHSLHARPLRIPLRWSAVFVLVNAGAACLLVADQFPGSLTEEEARLHAAHFAMLTPGQFKQLLGLSRSRVLPDGARVTEEGAGDARLYFTRRGRCRLYLRGRYAKDLEEGSFVNDVAFHRDGEEDAGDAVVGDDDYAAGTYGTAVADGEVEVLEWEWGALRDHLAGRPAMDRNVRACLTAQLVQGLLRQRRAAYERDVLGDRRDLPDDDDHNDDDDATAR